MEFHKGGQAAEGRRPTFVEAAEGRLHYGGWWGGKHRKNICKYVSDIYVYVYLAYFNIFPLRESWSYFISAIRMYAIETSSWYCVVVHYNWQSMEPLRDDENPNDHFANQVRPHEYILFGLQAALLVHR